MARALAIATLMAALWPATTMADSVEYYHLDALGTVRAVTNQGGTVIERRDYLPYGEECLTGPCAGNTPTANGQARRFTGKERDVATGLDYFGARYYGPKLARFTTVDPASDWRENLANPQRWNRYAYSLNNPYRYADPDGRMPRAVRDAAERVLFKRAREAAVRDAWKLEREILIKHGPGQMTIRLAAAEQIELMETGKVRGWIGHHSKNVADHELEAARDPANIKFVKGFRAHFDGEHGGSFNNPTTGALIDRQAILDNLLGLLPGAVLLDLVDLGGEAAQAAGDYVAEKVNEGPVGQHARELDAASRPNQQ